MEITQGLRNALEKQLIGMQQEQMIQDAQNISMRYRTQSGNGQRLLTHDSEALAYAAARMPATFEAVSDALENTISLLECRPQTLLDAGAGTGAASWAADEQLDLKKIICLEREGAMSRIGKSMMQDGSEILQNAKWIDHDLTKDEINEQADLVVASYVLNEMTGEEQEKVIKKLWNATNMILLLVEPGTPTGFLNLRKSREMLIKCGAHVVAPCTHQGECQKIQSDWCHFTCRVSRSKLHRKLKGGEVPYEDEKYMYISLMREKCDCANGRVLRHPQIYSGYVVVEVCKIDGIKTIKLSKKDGEIYKKARKAKAGDVIQILNN